MPKIRVGKCYLILDDWSNAKYVTAAASKDELKNAHVGMWILQAKLNLLVEGNRSEFENFELVGYEHRKIKKMGVETLTALFVKYNHFTWDFQDG